MSLFRKQRVFESVSSTRRTTYVEIRASSMVPNDGSEGHNGIRNLIAHPLVGVASGRDRCERRKNKVVILRWRLDEDSLYTPKRPCWQVSSLKGKALKRMKQEGTFWGSRKDRISLPVPSEPRSQGRDSLALMGMRIKRGSTFVPQANRRLATALAPRLN